MIKKLALSLSLLAIIPAVSTAGVPVIEATSTIFMPLSYIEQLQTQLNTINQYEQMILDYENQIKQLQNIVVNTRFDNIKITNLQDLQNALNLAKSRYLAAIQQYNSIATKTNKLTDDGCDFLNKVEAMEKNASLTRSGMESMEQIKLSAEQVSRSNGEVTENISGMNNVIGNVFTNGESVSAQLISVSKNIESNCGAVQHVAAAIEENSAGTETLGSMVRDIKIMAQELEKLTE